MGKLTKQERLAFRILIDAGIRAFHACDSVSGAVTCAAQEHGFMLTEQQYAEIIFEAQFQATLCSEDD